MKLYNILPPIITLISIPLISSSAIEPSHRIVEPQTTTTSTYFLNATTPQNRHGIHQNAKEKEESTFSNA
jgi:hypothetical protein